MHVLLKIGTFLPLKDFKISFVFVTFACIIGVLKVYESVTSTHHLYYSKSTLPKNINPCCSFPCMNGGICIDQSNGTFSCDCVSTGFYGKFCQRSYWSTWLSNVVRPNPELVHSFVSNYPWFWQIVNNISFLRRFIMRRVLRVRLGIQNQPPIFRAGRGYTTAEMYYNQSYYSQTLPPVPENCPTPMGIKGPKELPTINEVVQILFSRNGKEWKPNKMKSNVLFAAFAQHFTHMFFKSVPHDPTFTWGDHNIFLSHIYGHNLQTENQLRSFHDGKLKSQLIGIEEYPPYWKDVPVFPYVNPKNVSNQFSVGHVLGNFLPTTAMWQIIYLREHNRVATILKKEHPHWFDEQLFQTTKLILTGETLKIVVEDYVQHLSNYHLKLLFDPVLLHDEQVQYQNKIAVEFNILYHWHPLMSDTYNISGQQYKLSTVAFNASSVMDHSSLDIIIGMVNSIGGELAANNHPEPTIPAAKAALRVSRQLRLPGLNEYRKRFRLQPYKTFQEITGGNEDLACALRSLYSHVDAIEFFPGVIVEQHRDKAMFGASIIEIGSPYSLQGLFGNALSAPHLWRPATFGGDVGFQMVKKANLQSFICDNLPLKGTSCPLVQFHVPSEQELTYHQRLVSNESNNKNKSFKT